MNFKVYAFRSVVALTTLIFGVISFNVLQDADYGKPKVLTGLPPQTSHDVFAPTTTSLSTDPLTPNTETNESLKYAFDPSGSYFYFSKPLNSTNLPKAFRDFTYIDITTTDYKNASEKNSYTGKPIPPEGFLETKQRYNFSRINTANRQIAFETEIKKGISYKFIGKFPEYNESSTEYYGDLEGILTKMRNGRKIAEMKIRLIISGC